MNREQVLEQIAPVMDISAREVFHDTNTRFKSEGERNVFYPGAHGHALEINPDGMTSMLNFAGIAPSTAKKLSTQTLERATTELLADRERYNLLIKDGQIVGFTTKVKGHVMPAERVIRVIEQTIPAGEVEYNRALVVPKDRSVDLEVVGPRQAEVTKGDVLRGGALITFSPIGVVMPSVEAFVLRLWCTNGATHRETVMNYIAHGGGGDSGGNAGGDVWDWLKKSIRKAEKAVEAVAGRWHELTLDRIAPDDRAPMLEALLAEAHLPELVRVSARTYAMSHPPETAYDLHQIITWATSHAMDEATQVREIRAARDTAAEYASAAGHKRLCPVCKHAR